MDSFPQGNSKDIFNAGRRAVAIELINDVDSIDWPHRTSGFDLRQLADREYREFGLAVNDEIETLERRKSDAK